MRQVCQVSKRANGFHKPNRRLIGLLIAGLLLLSITASAQAEISWSGLGANDNWSNVDNWDGGVIPSDPDIAVFNATGSGGTNILDTDFTLAGLQYLGNGTHTTDFGGTSNLQVNGPLYVGYGGSADGADVTWTGPGTLILGAPTDLQPFYVGVNSSSSTVLNTASLLLDGPTVDAYTSDLSIGRKASTSGYGTADGSLILGSNSSLHVGTTDAPAVVNIGMNQSSSYSGTYGPTAGGDGTGLLDATQGDIELHLTELSVGRHSGYYGTATGTLRWDQPNPIDVDAVYFGRGPSTGVLEVPEGGTFLLGTAVDPLSLLAISYNDKGTGSGASNGHLDLTETNPTFEAFTSDLTIGAKTHYDGYTTADGSLILGSNSSLHVGAVDTPGVVTIGMNSSTDYSGTYGLRKKLSVNWFILHKRFSRSRQCSYSDIVSR